MISARLPVKTYHAHITQMIVLINMYCLEYNGSNRVLSNKTVDQDSVDIS